MSAGRDIALRAACRQLLNAYDLACTKALVDLGPEFDALDNALRDADPEWLKEIAGGDAAILALLESAHAEPAS